MDPQQEAVTRLESLVSRGGRSVLSATHCQEMIELTALVPGRIRAVAESLAGQRSACGLDALLQLPANVPGVVEGAFQVFAIGVTRQHVDGSRCPAMLAIDFRTSRARNFSELLDRAARVFGSDLERLRIVDQIFYRIAIFEGPGTLAGRVASKAADLHWLHARLAKLKGTRLWLNGWCFADTGPLRPAAHVHLVRAWMGWASQQVHTRSQT
ncbi:MAG: hypothetical protein V3V08_20810 [Nannocystaceae bacterium]